MPKLRNADTDLGMYNQWLARKAVNHDPLEELSMTTEDRAKAPRLGRKSHQHQMTTSRDKIKIVGENSFVYQEGNRTFLTTTVEIDPEDIDDSEVAEVGT